ncbi:MAG: hypothetical protein ABFR97_01110 [Thermodesulfobacteriota bacterium]
MTPQISEGDAKIMEQLKSAILDLDWEISVAAIAQLEEQVKILRSAWSDQRIPLIYLQIIGALGQYAKVALRRSHPGAVRLLREVFQGLEESVGESKLSDDEKTSKVTDFVNKYNVLKGEITKFDKEQKEKELKGSQEKEPEEPETTTAPEETPPEPEPSPPAPSPEEAVVDPDEETVAETGGDLDEFFVDDEDEDSSASQEEAETTTASQVNNEPDLSILDAFVDGKGQGSGEQESLAGADEPGVTEAGETSSEVDTALDDFFADEGDDGAALELAPKEEATDPQSLTLEDKGEDAGAPEFSFDEEEDDAQSLTLDIGGVVAAEEEGLPAEDEPLLVLEEKSEVEPVGGDVGSLNLDMDDTGLAGAEDLVAETDEASAIAGLAVPSEGESAELEAAAEPVEAGTTEPDMAKEVALPCEDLQMLLLSVEWEVGDQLLDSIDSELSRLRQDLAANSSAMVPLDLLSTVLAYIGREQAESISESMACLKFITECLAEILTAADDLPRASQAVHRAVSSFIEWHELVVVDLEGRQATGEKSAETVAAPEPLADTKEDVLGSIAQLKEELLGEVAEFIEVKIKELNSKLLG